MLTDLYFLYFLVLISYRSAFHFSLNLARVIFTYMKFNTVNYKNGHSTKSEYKVENKKNTDNSKIRF